MNAAQWRRRKVGGITGSREQRERGSVATPQGGRSNGSKELPERGSVPTRKVGGVTGSKSRALVTRPKAPGASGGARDECKRRKAERKLLDLLVQADG